MSNIIKMHCRSVIDRTSAASTVDWRPSDSARRKEQGWGGKEDGSTGEGHPACSKKAGKLSFICSKSKSRQSSHPPRIQPPPEADGLIIVSPVPPIRPN